MSEALRFSYIVCAIWAGVMGLFFWVAAKPIVGLFSEDSQVVASATTYLVIVPLSLWGYGVVIITAAAFNAIGRSH